MRTPQTPDILRGNRAGAGTAVDLTTGATKGVRQAVNNFANSATAWAKFTNAKAGSAVNTDVILIKGAGIGTKTIHTDVTYSGQFSAYADFMDYLDKVSCFVTKITIQTNDTDNFSSTLTFKDRRPNNTTEDQAFDLSEFRKTNAGGIADTLVIDGLALGLTPSVSVYFSEMAGDSWIKITFEIPAVDKMKGYVDILYN